MSIDPRSFDPRAFGDPSLGGDDAAQALAEDCGRALWQRDAASRAMGMRLDDIGPGRAEMVMTVRADMVNGHGSCHGGLIFSLADSCFGYASNAYDQATVAAGCSIEFIAPAHQGDVLRAVAEERVRSGRTGVYDVTVSNQDGRTIALLRGKSHRIQGEVVTKG